MKEKIRNWYEENKKTILIVGGTTLAIGLAAFGIHKVNKKTPVCGGIANEAYKELEKIDDLGGIFRFVTGGSKGKFDTEFGAIEMISNTKDVTEFMCEEVSFDALGKVGELMIESFKSEPEKKCFMLLSIPKD